MMRKVLCIFLLLCLPLLASHSAYAAEGDYRWTNAIGGSESDFGNMITTDTAGNVYFAGRFSTTVDFDPSSGVDSHVSAGSNDAFITSFSPDGVLRWTRTFGGTGLETVGKIAIDPSGNIYFTGFFNGTVDFDPSAGTDSRTSAGSSDFFLTSFTSDGTYRWAKTVGGTGLENASGVAIDTAGNLYVTGQYAYTVDFDPSEGTDERTESDSSGWNDAFLTSYTSDGTYRWTKVAGGAGVRDSGYRVVTDNDNNVYYTGQYGGTVDFDPSAGTDSRTSAGTIDAFISSFTADGTYRWTKAAGGTGDDYNYGIAVDAANNVYIAPTFSGTVDFDPTAGTDLRTSAGGTDIALSSFTADGIYRWTKAMGGTGADSVLEVTIDSLGNLYLAGTFSATVDFDPSDGTDERTSAGSTDAFISVFTTDGTYRWTKAIGGTGADGMLAVRPDSSASNLYLGGYFNATVDFDPSEGTDSRTSAGGYDIFLTSLEIAGVSSAAVADNSADAGGGPDALTSIILIALRHGEVDLNVTWPKNVAKPVSLVPPNTDQVRTITMRVAGKILNFSPTADERTFRTIVPALKPGKYPYTITVDYGFTTLSEKGVLIVMNGVDTSRRLVIPIAKINTFFRAAYLREPTLANWEYWYKRLVARHEVNAAQFLGAMQWQALNAQQ